MSYAVPLHHHPNDGSYRADCARCKLERAAPALYAALAALVAADKCNYCAEAMRHEGMFDAGRAALCEANA